MCSDSYHYVGEGYLGIYWRTLSKFSLHVVITSNKGKHCYNHAKQY